MASRARLQRPAYDGAGSGGALSLGNGYAGSRRSLPSLDRRLEDGSESFHVSSSPNLTMFRWEDFGHERAPAKDVLPPVGRKPYKSPEELRSLRWIELRWVHEVLTRIGRSAQLGLDKFAIKHCVKRSHFVAQFAAYLSIDPFVSNPHLQSLFSSFAVGGTDMADPREMTCAFRVLFRPSTSAENMCCFWFDTFSALSAEGETMCTVGSIPRFLLTTAVTYEEGQAIVSLSQPLLAHVKARINSAALVSRSDFAAGLKLVPDMLHEIRVQVLRRLSDSERMRVMREETEHAWDIVEQHEQRINQERAVRFIRNIMAPRQMEMWFHRWLLRAAWFKKKRQDFVKADRLFLATQARQSMRFWRKWARRPARIAKAKEMGARAMKKHFFAMWLTFYRSVLPLRRTREALLEQQFERRSAKVMEIRKRIDKRFNDRWKAAVFVAIQAEAQVRNDGQLLRMRGLTVRVQRRKRKRGAVHFYRKLLQKRCYGAWKSLWTVRHKKNVQRVADRKAAEEREAAQKAEEEAKEAAAQAAAEEAELLRQAKERAWNRQVQETRKKFETVGILARQAELRGERKAKQRAQRDAILAAEWAAVYQQFLEDMNAATETYLKTKEGKKWLEANIKVVHSHIAAREDIGDADRLRNKVSKWVLEFSWADVARQYVNSESKEIIYPKSEPRRKPRIDDKLAAQIVKDNYTYGKVMEAAKQMEYRRQELVAEENRNWCARILTKFMRNYTLARKLKREMREAVDIARRQDKKRAERARDQAARRLQEWIRNLKVRGGARNLMADLVLQLVQRRTDPATGNTYYVNAATGAMSWEPPKIFNSRFAGKSLSIQDPEWILLSVGAKGLATYQKPSTGETTQHRPHGYYMCVRCQRDFATQYCVKCWDRYCKSCYIATHNKGARVTHSWLPVPVKLVNCDYCRKRPAELQCDQCSYRYCDPCATDVHAAPDYKSHEVLNL